MAGARWVRRDILDRYPSAPRRVNAVWAGMVEGDSREAASGEPLGDPRVRHFWDGKKALGRYLAAREELNPGWWEGAAWDVLLLYRAGERCAESASRPLAWGSPIVSRRKELKRAVGDLLRSDRK